MPIKSSVEFEMSSIPVRPTNLQVIEACRILDCLDPEEHRRLAEHTFMAYAERSDIIWLSGSPAECAGIVGIGFVKLTKSTPHGQEVAVELLGPGQAFGMIAAIEGRSYPLSATAVTNCWYLKIPVRELARVYESSSTLKDQLIRSMGPRLRKAHDMMSRLSAGSVEQRIAAVLFVLADSYGRTTKRGIELLVPLTRHDLSELAGTTTETTIRILSRWQKRRIVSTDKQVITICQPDELLELLRS